MENIRQYIFSLVCMAILCGIIPGFFDSSSTQKKLLQFATGLLMMVVAISPLIDKEKLQFQWQFGDFTKEAQLVLSTGQEQADGMLRQIISQQTQAYILDKATSMGAELSVEVMLSDDEMPTPESVVLTGTASPYVRTQVTNMIVTDLAVSEDKIQWNY